MIATADRNFRYPRKGLPTVIIPYKAHYLVENAAESADGAPSEVDSHEFTQLGNGRTAYRRNINIDIMFPWDTNYIFNGDMNREGQGATDGTGTSRKEGEYRSVLRNLTEGIPDVSLSDTQFRNYSTEEMANISSSTAKHLLSSKFCFVPAGDTPTSRRLFDALAAGCVPIIFADFEAISENLPYPSSIDWSDIAVFAGSLKCAADYIDEYKVWLESLLDPKWESHIKGMSQRGQEVFARQLSYRTEGLATAMLDELSQLRRGLNLTQFHD